MNHTKHFFADPWKAVLKTALHPESNIRSVFDTVISKFDWQQRLYLDTCGGDVVKPNAVGQEWHSDCWSWEHNYDGTYRYPATLAASIYVEDGAPLDAPMEVLSITCEPIAPIYGTTPRELGAVLLCPPKGTVVILDVNVWHRGTHHGGTNDRVLPCLRMFHRQHLRSGWRPSRCISSAQMIAHYPEDYMQELLWYRWQYDMAQ